MSRFEPNAIVRGAQLTLVGANRALQNPALFTSDHYRQAALAVLAGIAIRLVISIPTLGVRALVWIISLLVDTEASTWGNDVVEGLEFVEHSVLQVPFFFMSLMRFVTPTLDDIFMDSLRWVDQTYIQKHKSDDPRSLRAMYYPTMHMYSESGNTGQSKRPTEAVLAFLARYGKKATISLAVYFASGLPYVGRAVLPAAGFYTFNKRVGPEPALIIFGASIFLPRRYLVQFMQSYFSSRSLMRELLEPYFARIKYTSEQKKAWFREREGVLFGFGVGFFAFLRIPLLGVLVYGIAEASTAYLVTKITDPPPPPTDAAASSFAESQIKWKSKYAFLALPVGNLDAHNVHTQSPKK